VTPTPENASTGQLIGQLTEQITTLVRNEARLAQAEVTQKAKRLGVGAGLFGGAGLFAFFGVAVLVAAAVLALAAVLPDWLAAVIVAVVLFAIAGVLALVGKKDVEQAAPPVPTQAIAGVQADIAAVKKGMAR
jgi:nitrate/nitrite transporter NarK